MKRTRHRGIVELATNRYEIRAHAIDPRSGRRREVRRERDCTLKEAIALQHQWTEELRAVDERPELMRLEDFARSWLAGRLAKKRLKPSSASKVASVLDVHVLPYLGQMYVDSIRPADVERWLQGQLRRKYAPGRRPRTGPSRAGMRSYSAIAILGHLRVLKTLSRAAKSILGLERDFCEGVEPPHVDGTDDNVLRADELGRVLAIIEARWPAHYPCVLILASTGLRWGEASALRWDDIDEAQGSIRVVRGNWRGQEVPSTKTRRRRTVPLDPKVAEVLREHRRRMVETQHPGLRHGWIFPDGNGRLHRSWPLLRVMRAALKAAGIARRVTVHGLRHTANDLLRRVASAEVVRSIVGHSTTAMTEHYSHVDADEKRAAQAAMLRLVRGAESGGESGGEGGARSTDSLIVEELLGGADRS